MTVEEIVAALAGIRPDQDAVIRGMADVRGLDSDNLTPEQYKSLLVEEAEWSLEIEEHDTARGTSVPGDLEKAQKYHDDLKAIAERI